MRNPFKRDSNDRQIKQQINAMISENGAVDTLAMLYLMTKDNGPEDPMKRWYDRLEANIAKGKHSV